MTALESLHEPHPHLVSGEFSSRAAALKAIERLSAEADLDRRQVSLVEPGDDRVGRVVEPDSADIEKTLVKSHLMLGAAGLLTGLVLATLLLVLGAPFAQSSPVLTYIVVTVMATFGGLLLGGLVALRPDHAPVLHDAHDASAAGAWTVVAHCTDEEQRAASRSILDRLAEDTSRSL